MGGEKHPWGTDRLANRRKPEVDPLTTLLSGLFILLIGVFVGADYVTEAREEQRIVAEDFRTIGTITDIHFKAGHSKHRSPRKVVEVSYADEYQRRHSVTYRDSYRSKTEGSKEEVRKKLIGSEVGVFYDRASPSRAVVEGEASSIAGAYRWGAGVSLFGLLFAVIGAWELKKKRQKRKAATAKIPGTVDRVPN